jgi:hypothetical protein
LYASRKDAKTQSPYKKSIPGVFAASREVRKAEQHYVYLLTLFLFRAEERRKVEGFWFLLVSDFKAAGFFCSHFSLTHAILTKESISPIKGWVIIHNFFRICLGENAAIRQNI